MRLDVRLTVRPNRSLVLTFALWVTFDRQQPRLEPLSQYSFLAIIVLLRHIPASERCMGFCGCVFVWESLCVCVFICVLVCLCTQAWLPFRANGTVFLFWFCVPVSAWLRFWLLKQTTFVYALHVFFLCCIICIKETDKKDCLCECSLLFREVHLYHFKTPLILNLRPCPHPNPDSAPACVFLYVCYIFFPPSSATDAIP